MRLLFWACGLIGLLFAAGCRGPSELPQGSIRLIVRGDDMGMTHTSNMAVEKGFREGILTCASILVPAPWFEESARMARENPEWCVGVHLAVNGEWRDYRWKPVLPISEVPSLVDEDGYLYPTTEAFLAAGPIPEEVDRELRAQMSTAIKRGINVQYVDTHMDTLEAKPELYSFVLRIAEDFGLPISGESGEEQSDYMNIYDTPPAQKESVLAEKLRKLGPGLWLLVIHPGLDTPESRALVDTNPEGLPQVAAHRAAEIAAITSSKIKKIIEKRGIQLVNYRMLQEQKE